ncbi:MAG: hypothetical protein C5B50_30235 [Verrucomicrobia bacterium]|nr:MAG: hypothetical protein C5B50_30235 [Verrucomicrobiota bacterium]
MGTPSFTIEARIDHLSDGVGCFDPIQVLHRMRTAFPNLIESTRDYLQETCDAFRTPSEAGAEKALRIAVRDMQERGPKVLFQIPLPDGRSIRGTAERYWVSVTSLGSDFPDDFRQRFIAFLETLRLQPIQIRYGTDI